MREKGLDSIPGDRRLDTLEGERNREGKGMTDGSLVFSKAMIQKGRRREGGEGSWCVNQRTATMMIMALIVTVTGVYGDSQGSFPSLEAQQSHMPPKGDYRAVRAAVNFTEGETRAAEGRVPCSSFYVKLLPALGWTETFWLPATHGLPHMGSSCGQPERMGPLSELRTRHSPPAALA